MKDDDLNARLRALGFFALADVLDDIIPMATKKRWSTTQLFEYVVALEEKERARRSVERRMSRSKLARFKTMADFDWEWPTRISADAIHAALDLDFMKNDHNVVLVGAQGLGKTMIAKNIVHNAVLAGHSALFITAADLLLDLAGQESARALDRRISTTRALPVCASMRSGTWNTNSARRTCSFSSCRSATRTSHWS